MPSAAAPCGSQRALGQEAGAAQRHLETGRRVFLDELHGAAAGEERADHVHAEPGDLRQQRLEVGLRERQRQRSARPGRQPSRSPP